jgi:hypothetical protein
MLYCPRDSEKLGSGWRGAGHNADKHQIQINLSAKETKYISVLEPAVLHLYARRIGLGTSSATTPKKHGFATCLLWSPLDEPWLAHTAESKILTRITLTHAIPPAAIRKHSTAGFFSERIISSNTTAGFIPIFQCENNWKEDTSRSIPNFHLTVVSVMKVDFKVGSVGLITWQLISRRGEI